MLRCQPSVYSISVSYYNALSMQNTNNISLTVFSLLIFISNILKYCNSTTIHRVFCKHRILEVCKYLNEKSHFQNLLPYSDLIYFCNYMAWHNYHINNYHSDETKN